MLKTQAMKMKVTMVKTARTLPPSSIPGVVESEGDGEGEGEGGRVKVIEGERRINMKGVYIESECE